MSARTNPDGTLRIHGKDYHPVSLRVSAFRDKHPIAEGWGILTELLPAEESVLLFRATITDPQGRTVATGFAEEKRTNRGINATSALENAETSAIGRALAAAGFGGDGGYASADELVNALSREGKDRKTDRERAEQRPTPSGAKGGAAPTPETPTEPEPHPTWEEAKKGFEEQVRALQVEPRDVAHWAVQTRRGHPCTWDPERRKKFIALLAAGSISALTGERKAG